MNGQQQGLSEQEAAERLKKFGPNALPEQAGKSAFMRFIAHFNDVLIYILLAAAFLKGIMGHWIDTVVILGVAVINALIGFVQENSAEKSLKGIKNMLSSQAIVVRDGINHTVNAEDLVPGISYYCALAIKFPPTCGYWNLTTFRLKKPS